MELIKEQLKNKVEIKFSYLKAIEVPNYFKVVTETSDSIYLDGFTYLSTLDIGKQGSSSGYQFIVASQAKEIVGALLFARLDEVDNVCTEGGTLNLFYVDVREDKRNQGISKLLFVAWAKYLELEGDNQEVIKLSYETILGKQANIHLTAKNTLVNHVFKN